VFGHFPSWPGWLGFTLRTMYLTLGPLPLAERC
jgi:hypothetical protein